MKLQTPKLLQKTDMPDEQRHPPTMNKRFILISWVLFTTLLSAAATHASEQSEESINNKDTNNLPRSEVVYDATPADSKKNHSSRYLLDTFVKDHLQIGVRSAYRVLTDADSGHQGGCYGSGTYLGTIYALNEKQNGTPILLNITYFFNKYIGLEIAYDRIEAETLAIDSSSLEEKSDGDVILSGPTVTLLARYRNSTNFIPYAGIGIGFYSCTFDADPEWTYASEYNGAAYNQMDLESAVGLQLTAGTKWLFANNWAIDLSVQYVQTDVDATYTGYYNDIKYTTQNGYFPLDNVAFRLGITYLF